VNGNLNLSRAIGDLKYKGNDQLAPADQIITAQPDIVKVIVFPKRCSAGHMCHPTMLPRPLPNAGTAGALSTAQVTTQQLRDRENMVQALRL
jgi:hypothetical protein